MYCIIHITLEGCVFIDTQIWKINPIKRSILVRIYVQIQATAIRVSPI